jgi:surface antigen
MSTKVLVAGLLLLISLPASALNWSFLQYSPVTRFTDQDWDLLRQAGEKALERGADGEIERWSNPATGASGSIQPLDTTDREGTTCRLTVISNSAGDASGTSRFTFCRQQDGAWRVAQ